ncbi:MAG: branched-chain amino acid ABC transporter permease [Chloroflexi bacterium]|nr:branched-chain amino acid ABC transporter permease [Chloroflexota bacterium]MBM3173250.1 branched-chain amino acid ABC transporter permease [Chloroflexota bacterium]MBM3175853.1 branched-chain amino acid ABC transporter permease [Chloroflexota bacterium]MBM4449768.1 branched-chain amino acid ABC transporter permease [Chloroflexota bacterium]
MQFFLELSINGLVIGMLYALVAVAIVIVCKATQVVSLAHGQLLAFGALFFYLGYVALGWPLWVSGLFALALGAILGFAAERLCLRPLIGQPLFSGFLMTFAIFMVLDGIFALILKGEAWGFPDFLPRGDIVIAGIRVHISGLYSIAICFLTFGLVVLLFQYTKMGLGMRATAESHKLSQSVGINVRTIFSMVWIISAVVAVVAGVMLARYYDIRFMLTMVAFKAMVVAIVGGLDSLKGAVVGGLILGWVENVAAGYLDPLVGGGIMEVAGYILLLFILLVRPYGIFGLVRVERI